MDRKFSPQAVPALKEALCTVYWYKADLRSFLENALDNVQILQTIDWNNYKRQIVSDLVDSMCRNQKKHLSDLTKLSVLLSKMNTFTHLESLEDGKAKANRAIQAINALREIVRGHILSIDEEEKIEKRRRDAENLLKKNQAIRERLSLVCKDYFSIISSPPQKRGYQLEKLMYDVFELFDLDPKASFKIEGEQIDGAFSLDGTDYLFEAKWQNQLTARDDLDIFSKKIERKLENTLGLFLSISGFDQSGVNIHSECGSSFLLMTGSDLMAVLEGRIDLPTMLIRKKRYAAQTGKILFTITEILS